MEPKNAETPSHSASTKRPPSDITSAQISQKRLRGFSSQGIPAKLLSSHRNAPPPTPTPIAPASSQQRVTSREESCSIGVKVATATLPQLTLDPTSFQPNRLAFINADLMMKARITQMNTHKTKSIQTGQLPGNADGGRSNIPVLPDGSAQLPPLRMTPSRLLPYITQNGHKVPTRSIAILDTDTRSSFPENTLPVTSPSQSLTQGRLLVPRSDPGAQLSDCHESKGTDPESTHRARGVVTADVTTISNSETPRTASRVKDATSPGSMRPRRAIARLSRKRRRPIVVDDGEESGDEGILIQTPYASHQSTQRQSQALSLSPSPQSLSKQTSDSVVPPELWSVRSAMGYRNWEAYVGLMERLTNQRITQRDFEVMTGRLFQMADKEMEKMVQRMAHKMVQSMGDQ